MTRANGEVVKFDVLCRLDTSAEVDVYKMVESYKIR